MANLEVYYRPNDKLTVKVEARGLEEVFQTLGPLQEILGNNCKCGKCGSDHIRMVHRKTPDGHDVYELMCEGADGKYCGAKLSLGKGTDGNLFPRKYEQEKGSDDKWRKKVDADGKTVYLPNNGWVKWDHESKGYV